MADDWPDMPPLVEQPSIVDGYPDTSRDHTSQYVPATLSQPAFAPGWGAPALASSATWGGYGQPPEWAMPVPAPGTPFHPAVAAPAMAFPHPAFLTPAGGGWAPPPKSPEPDSYSFPSSASLRPLSPFSNSGPSTPSSGNSNISRSYSMRSMHTGNHMRPPREWRADFNMPGALGRGIGTLLGRRRGSVSDIADSPQASRAKLHTYIRYSIVNTPMYYDLRSMWTSVRFRALTHHANSWDFTRFACEPPVPVMRLYSNHYPWFIDVMSGNPSGVNLQELFSAVYSNMMTQISHADLYNKEMDESTRQHIEQAYFRRCRTEEERLRGILRVDFLQGRIIWEGLVRGKDGMWEMKLRKL
ncbi:hypothetical protein CERSUDRAFT_116411 [Gelatoporia subvermispora B]|uniref:DUF6699 domain-containing protein n=1 Tax=Ceriporiopsis subvermispora (strain B) TaxID=914234 RepID=M2PHV3_CERS8|nr:hypothetical protein CERSUDRAFT_116411 [Gelatoporia subvermispora B]